jgi:hypothetical protein
MMARQIEIDIRHWSEGTEWVKNDGSQIQG